MTNKSNHFNDVKHHKYFNHFNGTHTRQVFLILCLLSGAVLLNLRLCGALGKVAADESVRAEITEIRQKLASRAAHFNWCLHADLLKLYERAGKPEKAMTECNEILLHKPFDEAMIAYLCKGDPTTNRQQVIAQLISTAEQHTWLTCVVGQCYLTVADLYLKMGDKAEAKKYYALVLQDQFAGTQKYYAEARISVIQLQTGTDPFSPNDRLEMCRSLIAAKPNVMNFETRNCLRELYHKVGKEADSMNICNQLLMLKPNDEYLVNVLSDWQLYKDNKKALANLMQRARSYNNLSCVRSACLLAAADLYVAAGQNSSAEKVYAAIVQDQSAEAEPYRVVAQVSLNLLHNTYATR